MSGLKIKQEWMQKTVVVWFGALLCCLLWGSAFPCIKIGYRLFEVDAADTASQILFAGSSGLAPAPRPRVISSPI